MDHNRKKRDDDEGSRRPASRAAAERISGAVFAHRLRSARRISAQSSAIDASVCATSVAITVMRMVMLLRPAAEHRPRLQTKRIQTEQTRATWLLGFRRVESMTAPCGWKHQARRPPLQASLRCEQFLREFSCSL